MRALTLLSLSLASFTLAQTPAATVTWAQGLSTPESVFFDPATDTYLVTNINGAPLAKDNNGFISELSPDGRVLREKLVEGGKRGATLHAPKGVVALDGVLYVVDIDTLRRFDRKTGAPKGEVPLPGATFANDVAVGPTGTLYVTDSGLNAKFEPTGTDAVWLVTLGKKPSARVLVKGPELHGPNGVLATAGTLYVVSFGKNELHAFDLAGARKGAPVTLPTGGLDGLEPLGDELLISSWEGKAVYRGTPAGPFTIAVANVEAPADLGVDLKRRRVLIPRFQGNAVEAWDVK
jgi:sugar lactone lactonase YvrE